MTLPNNSDTEELLSFIHEHLSYDAEVGEFRWKIYRPGRRMDRAVGTVDHDGYVRVWIFGVARRIHRLAWLYVYGSWPEGQLDHINGDRSDNRLVNLRECSCEENQQNKPMSRRTSRLPGVSRANSSFRAQIKFRRKTIHLGTFDTEEEAHAAYLAGKARFHSFQPLPREFQAALAKARGEG